MHNCVHPLFDFNSKKVIAADFVHFLVHIDSHWPPLTSFTTMNTKTQNTQQHLLYFMTELERSTLKVLLHVILFSQAA